MDYAGPSSPKRKKRKLTAPQTDPLNGQRSRWLYGIDVNNLDWTDEILQCPVFQPSREDFEDPFAFLQRISPRASEYGICKIVSPLSNITPVGVVLKKELQNFKFETSVQPLKYGTWATMEDKISYYRRGRAYRYEEFERRANQVFAEKYSSTAYVPSKMLEREFWLQMAAAGDNDTVEYGLNVEGSAFSNNPRDELGQSQWNLNILPRLQGSILRHLSGEIPGITSPMLYIGMVFSTFAWHVEDHYLYSINYLHSGAPKTWYGVPGIKARNFEKVAFDHVYSENVMPSYETDGAAQVLAEKTTMLPPSLFMKHNVPVFKAVQMPGEFVITFPRSYHAGFSHGFNCAEAVNFAVGDWFPFGAVVAKHYSFIERRPLIPFEELLYKEAILLYQQMTSPEASSIASSSQHYYRSQYCSIMASCITHIFYHRAARRKLYKKKLFLQLRCNTFGTVICGFCFRDRCLAFIMCHICQNDPSCVFHAQMLVDCCGCGEKRSLFLSDDMRSMEAATDYFEHKQDILFSYLNDTRELQKEIQELYGCEGDDMEESSTTAPPEVTPQE